MKFLYYSLIPIVYSLIGFIISYIRWLHFVETEISFYESERERFLIFHKIRGEKEVPDFLRYEWRDFVANSDRLRNIPPVHQNYHKELLIDFFLWPLTLLILFIKSCWLFLTGIAINAYNKVSTSKIDVIKKDLDLK